MLKKYLAFLMIFVVCMISPACSVQYESPETVKNEPGNCPNCGKMLVEKKDMLQTTDSTIKKNDKTKMMHDTTIMKKGQMKQDTIRGSYNIIVR